MCPIHPLLMPPGLHCRPRTGIIPAPNPRADMPAQPQPPNQKSLLDAIARALAPLVRLLIARGVSFQTTSELLKRTYVAAAQRHFADDGASGTRLSLLTGLNRKEIRRLTSDAADEKRPEAMASFAAATHAVWKSVRRWRDRDGNPKPLPRRAGVGTNPRQATFDDLVRSITLDHRPTAVLEELTRLGYAHEDANGFVHLDTKAFLSERSFEDRLLPLAENIEDHASAAVANVLGREARFLERSVFSDELSTESVEKLTQLTERQWQRIHDETVERAIACEAADAAEGREGSMRIRVGMYFYAEEKEEK